MGSCPAAGVCGVEGRWRSDVAVLLALAEVELVVHVFLGGNQGGLGQTLVVARNLDLFAVLRHFFHAFCGCSGGELGEFLLEVMLHLHGYLVCALGDDAHGLVDVAGVGRQLDHVASDGVERGVDFLVVHMMMLMFLGISL